MLRPSLHLEATSTHRNAKTVIQLQPYNVKTKVNWLYEEGGPCEWPLYLLNSQPLFQFLSRLYERCNEVVLACFDFEGHFLLARQGLCFVDTNFS